MKITTVPPTKPTFVIECSEPELRLIRYALGKVSLSDAMDAGMHPGVANWREAGLVSGDMGHNYLCRVVSEALSS